MSIFKRTGKQLIWLIPVFTLMVSLLYINLSYFESKRSLREISCKMNNMKEGMESNDQTLFIKNKKATD